MLRKSVRAGVGLSVVLGLTVMVAALASSARAQSTSGGITLTPQQASTRPVPRKPPSLADFVEKLDWNVATRGPLLIVSPEETTGITVRYLDRSTSISGPPQKPIPVLGASDAYDPAVVADYFDRKAVGMHSLTILAPTKMMTLLDRHLPKPDPYAALSSGAKMRLLESTFTAEQWQRIGSTEGIGTGDLTPEQRDIYLSLLPEPFTVDSKPTNRPPVPNAPDTAVTLTPEQRANIRLSLHKEIDWTFSRGPNSTMSVGGRNAVTDAGTTYRLTRGRLVGASQAVIKGMYGVTLTDEEPNRPKTSQLPEALQNSEMTIPLGGDQTVGELIHRIGQRIGAELYADPRYSERKLCVRAFRTGRRSPSGADTGADRNLATGRPSLFTDRRCGGIGKPSCPYRRMADAE